MGEKRYTLEDITKYVIDMFVGKLGLHEEHVGVDSRLSHLGADSLDFIEMIMDLEREYQIAIPDHHAEDVTDGSVGDVITYLQNRLNDEGKITDINKEKEKAELTHGDWLKPLDLVFETVPNRKFVTTIRRFELKEDMPILFAEPPQRANVRPTAQFHHNKRYGALAGRAVDILEEIYNKPNHFVNVSKILRIMEADTITDEEIQKLNGKDSKVLSINDIDRICGMGIEPNNKVAQWAVDGFVNVKKAIVNLEEIDAIDVTESELVLKVNYNMKKSLSALKRKRRTVANLNEEITMLTHILGIEEEEGE